METIKLYNKSQKTFHTSIGDFKAEAFLDLPSSEAKKLMAYPDIIDASTITGDSTDLSLKEITIKELRLKIQELEAEIVELKATSGVNKRVELEARAKALGLVKDREYKFNTPIEKFEKLIADKEAEISNS